MHDSDRPSSRIPAPPSHEYRRAGCPGRRRNRRAGRARSPRDRQGHTRARRRSVAARSARAGDAPNSTSRAMSNARQPCMLSVPTAIGSPASRMPRPRRANAPAALAQLADDLRPCGVARLDASRMIEDRKRPDHRHAALGGQRDQRLVEQRRRARSCPRRSPSPAGRPPRRVHARRASGRDDAPRRRRIAPRAP